MKINFLDNFGKIIYDFSGNGISAEMTNITKSISVRDAGESLFYTKYVIQDGERADQISQKLYGSPQYYWTLFLLNETLKDGLNGWPLSYKEFDLMIETEYAPYMFISGDASEPTPSYVSLPFNEDVVKTLDVYVKVGEAYVLTGAKIVRNDHKRYGLIMSRPSNYASNFVFGNNAPRDLFLAGQGNADQDAWLSKIPSSFKDENDYVILSYDPSYSYSHIQNSTYQYYSDEDPISHYDAIYMDKPNITRLTFMEYEKDINERKSFINVAKPSAIQSLQSEYFNSLSQ